MKKIIPLATCGVSGTKIKVMTPRFFSGKAKKMKIKNLFFASVFGLMNLAIPLSNAQNPALVKDINKTTESSIYHNSSVVMNGVNYFVAYEGKYGLELWRSDGSDLGTYIVKDIIPGTGSEFSFYSSPMLTVMGNEIYFRTPTGLWKSDGTAAGTVLLKNISIKYFGFEPISFTVMGNAFYFAVQIQNGSIWNYDGLWKSDGTSAGTVKIATCQDPNHFVVFNNALYFSAGDNYGGIEELWKSNGTATGTYLLKNIELSSNLNIGSMPRNFTAIGNILYFTAKDGINGTELWKTDGTSANTVMVKDIYSGSSGSAPSFLTSLGTTLYFAAYSGSGNELWKSDGTSAGTTIVKDIRPGSTGSDPSVLTILGSNIYFSANDGTNGTELWKSDGTLTGTNLFKNIDATGSSYPGGLFPMGNIIYFSADDGDNGSELWKSDGTNTGTIMVKDLWTGSFGNLTPNSSSPGNFTVLGNSLCFFAKDGIHDRELWKSDGTSFGTELVKDICTNTLHSTPLMSAVMGKNIYFSADDGINGNELWKSDGTDTGTTLIKNINPLTSGQSIGSFTSDFVVIDTVIYFTANDGATGRELWKTDGTLGGTTLVKDLLSGVGYSTPSELTKLGNEVFFAATANASIGSTRQLWKSDGTNVGTTLVKDIYSNFSPSNLKVMGNYVYFQANDGVNGIELWKSDGTAANTVMVKNIYSGNSSSSPSQLTVMGNILYFLADDWIHGSELWKSDGTSGGTSLVLDIKPGNTGSNLTNLTVMGNILYFAANDGVNGQELWKSDGTVAGTVMVKDIYLGLTSALSNLYSKITVMGNNIYFQANDGISGLELWKSDGTPSGTAMVKDIISGNNGSNPSDLKVMNGNIYFAANAGLWKSDGTTNGTILIDNGYSSMGNLIEMDSNLYFTAQRSNNYKGIELWKYSPGLCSTSFSTLNASSCGTYITPYGKIYNSSGTYSDTLINFCGYDSIISLHLTITNVATSVIQNNTTLTGPYSFNTTYQWLNCNTNYSIINNETNYNFTATVNGNYAVEITKNGCIDTSSCYNVYTVGIPENYFVDKFKVHPNPTKGNFTMDLGKVHEYVTISITDIIGKTIKEKTYSQSRIINLNIEAPAGLYFVKVNTGNQQVLVKVVKE